MPSFALRLRPVRAVALHLLCFGLLGVDGEWSRSARADPHHSRHKNDAMLWEMLRGEWETSEGWFKFYSGSGADALLKVPGDVRRRHYSGGWWVKDGSLHISLKRDGDGGTQEILLHILDITSDGQLRLAFGDRNTEVKFRKLPSEDL